MGQATRTTKLLLDVGKREEGGANTGKQASLEATASLLNHARAFYIDFFLGCHVGCCVKTEILHLERMIGRKPFFLTQDVRIHR